MKILLNDLGVLKVADFEIGDLTIICGKNNTGKTYAVYAFYGFLKLWRQFIKIKFDMRHIDLLMKQGSTRIDLQEISENVGVAIQNGCQGYSSIIHKVFASRPERFSGSQFKLEIAESAIRLDRAFEKTFKSSTKDLIHFRKLSNETILEISWLQEGEQKTISVQVMQGMINDALLDLFLSPVLPSVFMASAERTGAAIFLRELDFARNRLLEQMGNMGKDLDVFELMKKAYNSYPFPVTDNVDFTRDFESIVKNDSFLVEKHPDLLADFHALIGGEYRVVSSELYFIPQKSRASRLTMNESSSAVRSLLSIGLYLRHLAQPGEMLMVDEPEINLHPENQRLLARLFARLVNCGIKVFVTTHSDYLIKELNTLIMMNYLEESSRALVMTKHDYRHDELLSVDQIRVYNAGPALTLLSGNSKRSRVNTFTAADVSAMLGIEVKDFDESILKMNRIQEEILEFGVDLA
ncbi:MAG: AAA family ATPase [Magnetococcales bacterium]|nr:AAA family ATPase [Magnetococcales bacterium]